MELDDEFIATRIREENRVVQLRTDAARQVDEFSKRTWDRTNIEVDRIRSDYQNDYQEKKRALENLIELKVSEYEQRRLGQKTIKSLSNAAATSASMEFPSKTFEKTKKLTKRSNSVSPEYSKGAMNVCTVMKTDLREGSTSKRSIQTTPVQINPSGMICKELVLIRDCHGPKRVNNDQQPELSWSSCMINQRRQIRSGQASAIYRGQLKVKPNKEETIFCKVITLGQLPSSVRSHLLGESLSIMRYLCYNEGKRQARQATFIKIYEIIANDAKVIVYMREYSSMNLEDRFQHQQMDTIADWNENQLVIWTRQICDGVLYLHGLCIAHLNIRPSNILFDKKDNVKLAGLSAATLYFDFEANKAKFVPKFIQPKLVPYLPSECTEKPHFDAWFADIWCVALVIRQILQRVKTFCVGSVNTNSNNIVCTSTISSSIKIRERSTERTAEKLMLKRNVINDKHTSKRSIDTNRVVLKLKTINRAKLFNDAEDFIDRCVVLEPTLRLKPMEVVSHPLLADYN